MDSLRTRQVNWLQSSLNAAAGLVYSAQRSEYMSPLIRDLYWLKSSTVNWLPSRCHLATFSVWPTLVQVVSCIPQSKHSTISDRAFPVTVTKVWNSPSPSIMSSPSLLQIRRVLNMELFRPSYSDARHWMNITANVTAALQSSMKTISVALKFMYDDDDDECNTATGIARDENRTRQTLRHATFMHSDDNISVLSTMSGWRCLNCLFIQCCNWLTIMKPIN